MPGFASHKLQRRANSRRGDTRGQGTASTKRTALQLRQGPTMGPLTDRDVAERFADTVTELGYDRAELARLARCTKDGSKHWVDASRCPSLPKALEMARADPAIRKWLIHEAGETAEFESSENINRAIREQIKQVLQDLT